MRSICRIPEPSASALMIATCLSMLRMFAMFDLPMAINVLQKDGVVKSFCVTIFVSMAKEKRSIKRKQKLTPSKKTRTGRTRAAKRVYEYH